LRATAAVIEALAGSSRGRIDCSNPEERDDGLLKNGSRASRLLTALVLPRLPPPRALRRRSPGSGTAPRDWDGAARSVGGDDEWVEVRNVRGMLDLGGSCSPTALIPCLRSAASPRAIACRYGKASFDQEH
jgi:hypothetical protein